jgi:hypothetical protein
MGDSSESIHDPVLAADQSPAPAPEDQQTMHVHKIKPVHGWKEFLNEILIIVIGVLIALGLEQVVEEVHWRNKVADAEQRLKTEETANFGFAAEQVIVTPCILAQLNRVAPTDPSMGKRNLGSASARWDRGALFNRATALSRRSLSSGGKHGRRRWPEW